MTTKNDRSELLEQLTEGISNLTTSDEWQRYLDCQSRFYRYSSNNVMLIAQQATRPRGSPGSTPGGSSNRSSARERRPSGFSPPWSTRTLTRRRRRAKVIRGFKWVPVFDIASTDGEELPSVCNRLAGDDPAGLFARLIEFAPRSALRLRMQSFPAASTATALTSMHRIRVEITNSPAQRVKTLAHEIGPRTAPREFDNRALAELEAESTAYVICQALGLDTSDYSFGYVAGWAGGGEQAIAGIKGSCERIQKAAASVLQSFEVGNRSRRHKPSASSATRVSCAKIASWQPQRFRSTTS